MIDMNSADMHFNFKCLTSFDNQLVTSRYTFIAILFKSSPITSKYWLFCILSFIRENMEPVIMNLSAISNGDEVL